MDINFRVLATTRNPVIYDGQPQPETPWYRRSGDWRSPTGFVLLVAVACKARFVLHDQRVKNNPLHNQYAGLTVHTAMVQLKRKAATSFMSTKLYNNDSN